MAFRNYSSDEIFLKHVRANPEGNYAEVDMLGIDLFSTKDKIDLPTIARYFTLARKMVYRSPDFCFHHARNENDTYFLLHCKLEIKRSLYHKALIKDIWLKVRFSMELLGMGNSTLLFLLTMRDLEDGDVLASTFVKMIKVDMITRKSSSFSDSFLAKYAQFANQGKSLLPTYRPLVAPVSSFRHQFVIPPSDTDFNGHTGNHIYAKMCLDCAYFASRGGYFKKFLADLDQPKTVERYYAKECGENDVVDVFVWEDGDAMDLLHFQLRKATILLCCMDVEFYSSETVKSKL